MLNTDDDGYIIGYQQEYFDHGEWHTPFDTTNAVELSKTELDKIVLGASKLVDDAIVVDQAKLNEIKEAAKPQPTPEQLMLAALSLEVAKLKGAKA
ncbi:phage infection protein [Lacticaseibacillus absianus]|uniref:phage infection protein n=1 Tax=Lacticaseibacillus absianus TaxID=2729623 RepID=UPI0015CA96D7|nr:phage infection protein [Lacticaseibacillus absianus]